MFYVSICIIVCNLINNDEDDDNDGKGKVLPYSLLSVGPGADPGVQVT